MTTPAGLDEQRILVVPVAGRFEGVRVFLRSSDILYAFLGSKAFACVHAPWVGRYKYNDRTVYARSRTLGLVRVRIAALTRLGELLGRQFVQSEHGVLVNLDAVFSVGEQRPGGGCVVGVLVDVPAHASPIVEEVVASRNGRRELVRRLSSRWPARSSG